MVEQLIKIGMRRENVILFWGAHDLDGFYDLDVINSWIKENNNLKCILATNNVLDRFDLPNRIDIIKDSLVNALQNSSYGLTRYDAYIAGPPSMMPSVLRCITSKGLKHEGIKVDSFGG